MQAKPVAQVAQEARNFAASEFMPAMLRIDTLTPQQKKSLLTKFSMYTGLSTDFVDRNNFRIELDKFNKELLRDRRRTTGRLDSRFLGIDRDAGGDGLDRTEHERDPASYTAVFNDYVRRELGYKSDVEYYILGGGITARGITASITAMPTLAFRSKTRWRKTVHEDHDRVRVLRHGDTLLRGGIHGVLAESGSDTPQEHFVPVLRVRPHGLYRENCSRNFTKTWPLSCRAMRR